MPPLDQRKRQQLGADSLLLLVTLVWGSTFVTVKDAVAAYPVFPFLALRFGFAALVLLVVGWRRLRSLGWRGVGSGVLVGAFLFAGYAFQTLGLRHATASRAGIITGLSVAIVPLLSALLLRRLPKPESIAGVGLATIGLALLSLDSEHGLGRGDALVLLCALSFALHIVSVSAFAPRMDPLALTLVQVTTVSLASATVSLFADGPWPVPSASTWFSAAFTGVVATAAAFAIHTSVQRFTTPTHTALVFAGEPLFAALFGTLLAGDVMTAGMVAGGVFIVVGTVVSEIRWCQRTATIISRFLSPHYVAGPLLLALGLADTTSWKRGVLWTLGIGLLAIGIPLLIMTRELGKGSVSDWHLSVRKERLQPMSVFAAVASTGIPLMILLAFDGPSRLLVAFLNALVLVVCNLLITLCWKISQHVSTIAASATLVTVIFGVAAAPFLLLIPLVAWARVRVGAHSVMQTVAGGVAGVVVTLVTLRFLGVA